uniref:Uncharacterized protein n=1 Tax=Arundo donax TaxID=35708 RepID=A0A0A9GYI4_ARUDO
MMMLLMVCCGLLISCFCFVPFASHSLHDCFAKRLSCLY